MPNGGLFVAAVISLLLCLYILFFRKEALAAFDNIVRRIFWGYLILSSAIILWGLIAFLTVGFPK